MIISITDSCADVVFLKCLPSQHLNEFMFHLFFGKLKYFVDFPTTLLLAYIWIFCFDFNPAELNLQIGFFFPAQQCIMITLAFVTLNNNQFGYLNWKYPNKSLLYLTISETVKKKLFQQYFGSFAVLRVFVNNYSIL